MKFQPVWAVIPLAALLASPALGVDTCSRCGHGGTYTHMDVYKDAYWDNSIWPRQYVQPARRGICQAYEVMVNNGWRRHHLLGKYHFNSEGTELSEAGKLKVQWALTQTPENRRVIFVERGVDEQETAARIAAVQTLASTINGGAAESAVQETHIRDEGHPAGAVDAMFTGFRAGQLPPVLPQASSGTSSGSSQ